MPSQSLPPILHNTAFIHFTYQEVIITTYFLASIIWNKLLSVASNGLLCGSDGKDTCNVGDLGLIPGLGRFPGYGNGYPLQYSCLENSMDRGAWWATVHGVTESHTHLSDFTPEFLLDQTRISNLRMSFVSNLD